MPTVRGSYLRSVRVTPIVTVLCLLLLIAGAARRAAGAVSWPYFLVSVPTLLVTLILRSVPRLKARTGARYISDGAPALAKASKPYFRFFRAAGIVAAGSAAALVARPESLFLWPILVSALISLIVAYFLGRKVARDIQALWSGKHLAHWRYGDEEWRRFTESEWVRVRSKSEPVVFLVVGIGAATGLVVAWQGPGLTTMPGLLSGTALGLLFGIAGGLALGVLVAAMMYLSGRSTYRNRLAAAGEVFIGEKGVFIGKKGVYRHGSYFTWLLGSVEVELEGSDPAVIRFDVTYHRGGVHAWRLPVPRGRESEARALVARFTAFPEPAEETIEDLTILVAGTASGDPGDLRAWLDGVMARFRPDQLHVGPGEPVGSAFMRIIADEEQKVRDGEPRAEKREVKLRALAELRRRFA